MRPTIRLRMTLLYAGVFFVAGALLLSVSYVLVRNNLTDPAAAGTPAHGDWALQQTISQELASDALGKLRAQYAIALAAMTGLSVLLGWGGAPLEPGPLTGALLPRAPPGGATPRRDPADLADGARVALRHASAEAA